MNDLRDKIRNIIEQETKKKHFSVLNLDSSVDLIQRILEDYEITNDLKQDMTDLPKKAELVFVAAPTGAGKDSLVTKLNCQNPDKKYIELNMDIFRQYFSVFIKDTKNLTDKNFARMTNEFSYEIYVTIQEILLQEFPGTNIIITGTLREIDWVEKVFERFKSDEKTDYTIRLVSLSVPEKESAISIIQRYVGIVDTQRKEVEFIPGTARYTSMGYHNETFKRFPENLEYFQEIFFDEPGRMIDVMEVYKRSRNIGDSEEDTKVYSSENQKQNNTTAIDMIMELRKKEYRPNFNDVMELIEKIKRNITYFKEQETLKEIIRELAILLNFSKMVERLDKISYASKLEQSDGEK